MQCPSCGHERPRTGNCPHCGAALAGGKAGNSNPSSLRGWREQANPAAGPARPSRPNWDDQRPISRPVSRPLGNDPARSRGSGANWGSANQGGPNQSYPRRNDPNQSYARRGDDYGDERGLMLAPDGGAIMPQLDDRALPALPTEEEERALGIRRPAFIPATDERKGKKPGRWRVISGVASIMVLCVAMCGVTGLLAQRNVFPGLSKLLGIKPPSVSTTGANIPDYYLKGTLLVTPVPTAKTPIQTPASYSNITPGTSPSSPVIPKGPTDIYALGSTAFVVMQVNEQAKVGDKIGVHWLLNGQDVTPDLQKTNSNCCFKPETQANTALQVVFELHLVTIGNFQAQIYYNTTLAYTLLFVVVPSNQVPTTPTATVHATATKHP